MTLFSKKFWKHRRGISLTGYGLLVGLIAVVAISAINRTGDGVNRLFTNVDTIMTNAAEGRNNPIGSGGGGGSTNLAGTSISFSSGGSIAENSPQATSIGNLTTDDPEGDSITYTLTNDDGGRFQLSTAQIQTSATNIDFETDGTPRTITVEADDGQGNQWSDTLNITINDVIENTAPTLLAGNVINLGPGPFIDFDVTVSLLSLFTDAESNTPLFISAASTPDGVCITGVSYTPLFGFVEITAADATCSGTILVEMDDSLGATSASTSIQFDVLPATSALFAGGDGTPIGDIGDGTGGPLSVAFDGITSQDHSTGPRKNANGPSFIGKDWGTGISRIVTRFEIFGSSNLGFANGGGFPESTLEFIVQGSNDNIAFTNLFTTPVFTDSNGLSIDHSFSANPSTDAYRYHRILMNVINHPTAKNCCNIAELRFYGYQLP